MATILRGVAGRNVMSHVLVECKIEPEIVIVRKQNTMENAMENQYSFDSATCIPVRVGIMQFCLASIMFRFRVVTNHY